MQEDERGRTARLRLRWLQYMWWLCATSSKIHDCSLLDYGNLDVRKLQKIECTIHVNSAVGVIAGSDSNPNGPFSRSPDVVTGWLNLMLARHCSWEVRVRACREQNVLLVKSISVSYAGAMIR